MSTPLRLGARPSSDVSIYLAALGPRAVQLCGEFADGWYPFRLPVSGLKDGVRLLEKGASRRESGRARPQICPGVPVAVASDPTQAPALASWWVAFYLTSMGPLYGQALRILGLGDAVDAVLAANRTRGSAEVPVAAQVLIDELTVSGDATAARAGLERWYAAGAEMPVIVMPPNQSIDEVERTLHILRPTRSS